MKRLLGVLLICMLLSGCGKTQTVESSRRLNLTATIDQGAYVTLSAEDLGGNYEGDIHCGGLADVAVTLDGKSYPLAQAIGDGRITVEELIAYARIDARNDICGEVKKTKNGLTYFVYCYPDYYVYTAYDVYETPAKGDVLVSEFGLMAPGDIPSFLATDENGDPVDLEDWGLTLEVAQASEETLTLRIHQSGGQQLGSLLVGYDTLYRVEETSETGVDAKDETLRNWNAGIEENDTTELTVDLAAEYGILPAGNYRMALMVKDDFDKECVHPLMRDYYDRQTYVVEFTVE